MNKVPGTPSDNGRQAGSGVLSVVAALGLILLLVQGTNFYRARESARFLTTEKNKVLALQIAEAGVEDNIADLGKGTTVVTSGMTDVVTYDQKVLDGGNFTSRLSTVAMGTGALPDTVDLVSSGVVGAVQQTIQARLRLNKTTTTLPAVAPPDPSAAAPLTTTPEYTACMAPMGTCKVCHLPLFPDTTGIHILTPPKAWIGPSHNAHTGDYLVPLTATSCNRYEAVPAISTTAIKVQILAWK